MSQQVICVEVTDPADMAFYSRNNSAYCGEKADEKPTVYRLSCDV